MDIGQVLIPRMNFHQQLIKTFSALQTTRHTYNRFTEHDCAS